MRKAFAEGMCPTILRNLRLHFGTKKNNILICAYLPLYDIVFVYLDRHDSFDVKPLHSPQLDLNYNNKQKKFKSASLRIINILIQRKMSHPITNRKIKKINHALLQIITSKTSYSIRIENINQGSVINFHLT